MNSYEYHKILSPDFPDFLHDYISLPIFQRLDGVGLLCGTDWTKLYSNRFSYTRFDHSVGTALITWHFTHSKKQSLASLFHDVATPAFSHVSDFRNGDAMKQESTEEKTSDILTFDQTLRELLARDGINECEIRDYHIYPVCDNKIPRLSSDRLEYMFPSAMAMADKIAPRKTWTLDEVKSTYDNIRILKNEDGADELGFLDAQIAEDYCIKFNDIGLLLLKNENKVSLSLLGKILSLAEERKIASEDDFMTLSERRLIQKFTDFKKENPLDEFSVLFRTFTNMTSIIRSEREVPGCYCVSIGVKKRYIDPLVKTNSGERRISDISQRAKESIENLLGFEDAKFGCARLITKS